MRRLLFLLPLLAPALLAGQTYKEMTVRTLVGHYDYDVHGALISDTSGTKADTFNMSAPLPAGAVLLRSWVVVSDSLKTSIHADSSTIAIKVDTTTVKAAQCFRCASGGWLPAEAVYPADSSLVLAGTTGRPKVLPRRGRLNMIVLKWPLSKGILDVYLQYLAPGTR